MHRQIYINKSFRIIKPIDKLNIYLIRGISFPRCTKVPKQAQQGNLIVPGARKHWISCARICSHNKSSDKRSHEQKTHRTHTHKHIYRYLSSYTHTRTHIHAANIWGKINGKFLCVLILAFFLHDYRLTALVEILKHVMRFQMHWSFGMKQ